MNIEKKLEDSTLTIALEGRLDTTTSPDLEEALGESLDGVTALVFDFTKLDYVSSAGRMNKQGSMKLVHVNDAVKEVFDITGFADFLTIE